MSITLETVLGNAVADQKKILYVQVERTRRPTVTANFARNIGNGYVVVEAPENIERFLMDIFAKDEQELVSVYDMEEEERTRGNNEKERKKVEEWEKGKDRLIGEWQERENRRIPDWEERERQRRAEYELEVAIKQEEAERASLSYPKLIFDALESKGIQIGAIRTHYRQHGCLSDLRTRMLRQLLSREGIQDEGVLDDIVNLTSDRNPVLKESLREILVKQLGVVFPEVKPLESLPPYEPEPIPEPEPKPNPGPRPGINIIEPIPLQKELESVVSAAYKGASLEEINLTQQTWNAAEISPQEIYDRIRGSVRFLNSQYMLVRVIGNGDGNAGSLTLVGIDINHKGGLKQGIPKLLRSSFQRPTELVEDAYTLSLILWSKVNSYLDEHEGDNEVFSNVKAKEDVHLARTIYKAILGRTTPLITNLFPELTESSVSEDELSKYENIAQRVKSAFEEGLLDAYDISYEGKIFKVSANKLVDTIRYLVDLLPEELFELRYQTTIMDWSERTVRKMPLIDHKRNRRLNASGIQYVEGVKVVGSGAKEKASSLTSELGILAEGREDEWKLNAELGLNAATNVLNRYGIGYTTGYTNQTTGK